MKMTHSMKVFRRAERGVAAVEAAVLLPILIFLLAAVLLVGRYFWYYTAAEKAAHDAARYLSSVSQREIKTPASGGGGPAVMQIAYQIATQETGEIKSDYPPFINIECKPQPCSGFNVPSKVRVFIQVPITDPFFSAFTTAFAGEEGFLLTTDVTMPYVGI